MRQKIVRTKLEERAQLMTQAYELYLRRALVVVNIREGEKISTDLEYHIPGTSTWNKLRQEQKEEGTPIAYRHALELRNQAWDEFYRLSNPES